MFRIIILFAVFCILIINDDVIAHCENLNLCSFDDCTETDIKSVRVNNFATKIGIRDNYA